MTIAPSVTGSEKLGAAGSAGTAVSGLFAGYSQQPARLVNYAELVGLFNLAFAVFLAATRISGRPLPERLAPGDIVLLGVATYKLSRIVAKDLVASPFRAPFTTFEGLAGEGEVNEKPRGEGMQRVVGELLTCPFCLGVWVAAFFAYGLVLSPSLTRLVGAILAAATISDFLHLAYSSASVATEKEIEAQK